MTRVFIVVEGQSEEAFVKNVLSAALLDVYVLLTPIVLGPPGHKGGNTSYARVKSDIVKILKQHRSAYCSTMIDLYGLGAGFPGNPPPGNLSGLDRVRHLEGALKQEICSALPDEFSPGRRFIPYLQLHEYEAVLFSDPATFAKAIGRPQLGQWFQSIRDQFDSPEDINDGPETAPSKRVLAACPQYKKVIEGVQAASAVGIAAMRAQCRHFREWIESLEALGIHQDR